METIPLYTKYIHELKLRVEKNADPITQFRVHKSSTLNEVAKTIHERYGNEVQEHFYVFFMTVSHKIIAYSILSKGGISGTVADIRLILTTALLSGCTQIALVHNHPSGSLKPSNADEKLTRKIKEAAILMDIKLLDHIILADDSYYSFLDEGIL